MDFSALTARALAVREGYEECERRTYGQPWSLGELTLGLVGDVGDLVKLVQAREGVTRYRERAGEARARAR